jgi:hypothetical protein
VDVSLIQKPVTLKGFIHLIEGEMERHFRVDFSNEKYQAMPKASGPE